MNVMMKELPAFEVAYVRHVGSYLETYKAWAKLGEWAGQNGLFPPEQAFIGISLDDPAATEEFACRYDACVTVPDSLNREDAPPEVQFRTLPGDFMRCFIFTIRWINLRFCIKVFLAGGCRIANTTRTTGIVWSSA